MTVPGQFDHIIGELLTKFHCFDISQIESVLVMTVHCRILNRLLLKVLRAKVGWAFLVLKSAFCKFSEFPSV